MSEDERAGQPDHSSSISLIHGVVFANRRSTSEPLGTRGRLPVKTPAFFVETSVETSNLATVLIGNHWW